MNTKSFWSLEKPTNIILHGVMLLCLIMFLSSCSSPKVEQVKLLPPEVFLQQVQVEPCPNKTNEDLLKCYLKTKKALKRANEDKRKIEEWYRA